MSIDDVLDKVFVINLKSQKRRLNHFIDHLEIRLKERLNVFEAVDGRNLDIRIINDSIITDKCRKSILNKKGRYGIDMTYGALGCALSHMLILRQCSVAKKPFLIFEDDIVVEQGSCETLIRTLTRGAVFDILYLGVHNIPSLNKSKTINDELYQPQGLICGTFGMVITPQGASKILKNVFPLSVQIDSEISRNQNKLKLLSYINPLVKHNHMFGSSTQGQEGRKTYGNY